MPLLEAMKWRRLTGERARRRFRANLFGQDLTGTRESLAALVLSSIAATAAGVLLAALTDTLERLPGLLVLVPAAIGMRGNIFGALGSRLATTIHAGTYRPTVRSDTVVGQNIAAVAVLTLATAVLLGVITKVLAPIFGLTSTISLADLVVVSTVGAVLASVVVLLATLGLASGTTRYGWDLDNVSAPLISTVGDFVTLPALFMAGALVSLRVITPVIAVVAVVFGAVTLAYAWWRGQDILRNILRDSLPVLSLTGVILVVAGVVIEHRLEAFTNYKAVLVLVPACLATAGAIGGILSSRLSTKFHLGVIEPSAFPSRSARRDLLFGFALAVPVFAFNGILAHLAALALNFSSPGLLRAVAVSMIGGMLATVLAAAIAYYGTAVANRVGIDPDTLGIPLVTSTVDLGGAASLVLAVGWMGLS